MRPSRASSDAFERRLDKALYYMSVIDEASRWSLIFFLEHKDDDPLAMDQAIKYFKMHGHGITRRKRREREN